MLIVPGVQAASGGGWYEQGNEYYYAGDYEQAIECYDKALEELDPDHEYAWYSAFAWHNKGGALYKLERYDEAIVCYNKALELDPNDVDAAQMIAKAESALNAQQAPTTTQTTAPTTTQQAPLSSACVGFAVPLSGLAYIAGRKIRGS